MNGFCRYTRLQLIYCFIFVHHFTFVVFENLKFKFKIVKEYQYTLSVIKTCAEWTGQQKDGFALSVSLNCDYYLRIYFS